MSTRWSPFPRRLLLRKETSWRPIGSPETLSPRPESPGPAEVPREITHVFKPRPREGEFREDDLLRTAGSVVYSLNVNLPTVSPMRFIALLTALLWSLVANHCYLSVALAAPAPATHDCHDQQSRGTGDRHDGCPIKVCCEKIAPMLSASPDVGPTPLMWLDLPNLLPQDVELPLVSCVECSRSTIQAVGPPSKILLLSLSLAPNAPPR